MIITMIIVIMIIKERNFKRIKLKKKGEKTIK
jgi:hypothetical protein